MNKYLKSKKLRIITLILVLDGLFYGLFNPNSLNLLILVSGILLFAVNIYVYIYIIILLGHKFGYFIKNPVKLSFIIMLVATLILCLETLGQLSAKDIIVTSILGVLIYLYLEYIHPRPKKG